jgi:hypothetical protein
MWCRSVAGGEGQQRWQLFFCGQLVWSRTERHGRRQGDVGEDGMVVRPFIGSGRRGGGLSRGRAIAG